MAIIDRTPRHNPKHRDHYPEHISNRDTQAEFSGMADYRLPPQVEPRHRAEKPKRDLGSRSLRALLGRNVRPV